jgi:hypothetical protein
MFCFRKEHTLLLPKTKIILTRMLKKKKRKEKEKAPPNKRNEYGHKTV